MTTKTLTRLEADVKSYLDIDEHQAIELCDELTAYGINTLEEFEDAFYYRTDSWRPNEEFAEHLFTEVDCEELHPAIQGCVDWEVVWNSHYRFDFFSVTVSNNTYYFFNS